MLKNKLIGLSYSLLVFSGLFAGHMAYPDEVTTQQTVFVLLSIIFTLLLMIVEIREQRKKRKNENTA